MCESVNVCVMVLTGVPGSWVRADASSLAVTNPVAPRSFSLSACSSVSSSGVGGCEGGEAGTGEGGVGVIGRGGRSISSLWAWSVGGVLAVGVSSLGGVFRRLDFSANFLILFIE